MTVDAPFRTQVTVTGMTCRHCVASVTEELAEIDGVTAVDVHVESGAVTILSSRVVGHDEITAAVTGAGYELTG